MITSIKTNLQLQNEVQEAINWEPLLKPRQITVEAFEGMITLSGIVESYIKKSIAEDVTKKIAGVKAVVEKIKVKINTEDEKSDVEIACDVLRALKANTSIPFDRLQIEVENGHVILDGNLEWNYQRNAAQKAASNIDGIKVLTNNIIIEVISPDEVEKAAIEQAIARNWAMNNHDVQVYVSKNEVTLHGIVHSFYQKEEAERMSWNAPGVRTVKNEIIIDYANNKVDDI